jgi:3'-phosphoadenosine 5'-phosphosulfate sulfotransferase (PAPS reductase)/FAD synthetase
MTKAVVFFSGGLMSWAAAKRAVATYGAKNTTLVFTDTLIEDPDLYRFLDEAASNVGAPLVKLTEGRTPWQVFRDEKLIGNTRADPCSKILKRQPGEAWLKANCDPLDTVLIFGIHWEEKHRLEGEVWDRRTKQMVRRGVRPRYQKLGYPRVEAPMCETPWKTAQDIREMARAEGLALPRLYGLGFAHNNCGSFCVKAGEGHFLHLLRTLPQLYAYHEDEEEAFNASRPGRRPQTVLAPERVVGVDERGKIKRKRVPMSLKEFREAVTAGEQFNQFDLGGCGCFLDAAA